MKKMLKIGSKFFLNLGYSLIVWLLSHLRTLPGMGALSGAVLGGNVGASTGIAALGGAINGALPLAIILGFIGWLLVKLKCSKTNEF